MKNLFKSLWILAGLSILTAILYHWFKPISFIVGGFTVSFLVYWFCIEVLVLLLANLAWALTKEDKPFSEWYMEVRKGIVGAALPLWFIRFRKKKWHE